MYNMSLPSKHPLEWIEQEFFSNGLGVISFGAYNAFGLIGPEGGGVAIVNTIDPSIIAIKTIPYSIDKRKIEFENIKFFIDDIPNPNELPSMLEHQNYNVR